VSAGEPFELPQHFDVQRSRGNGRLMKKWGQRVVDILIFIAVA
jgi:hypothetical protein